MYNGMQQYPVPGMVPQPYPAAVVPPQHHRPPRPGPPTAPVPRYEEISQHSAPITARTVRMQHSAPATQTEPAETEQSALVNGGETYRKVCKLHKKHPDHSF